MFLPFNLLFFFRTRHTQELGVQLSGPETMEVIWIKDDLRPFSYLFLFPNFNLSVYGTALFCSIISLYISISSYPSIEIQYTIEVLRNRDDFI
ncbi:hypothetical protein BDZ91DRAFT_185626 [Kalaharituber pfeilii]|nr:hypothetical protein BDZ91DRAFT_185626 [Kalaharituber pfeilii]